MKWCYNDLFLFLLFLLFSLKDCLSQKLSAYRRRNNVRLPTRDRIATGSLSWLGSPRNPRARRGIDQFALPQLWQPSSSDDWSSSLAKVSAEYPRSADACFGYFDRHIYCSDGATQRYKEEHARYKYVDPRASLADRSISFWNIISSCLYSHAVNIIRDVGLQDAHEK